jgi:hypothetical protein
MWKYLLHLSTLGLAYAAVCPLLFWDFMNPHGPVFTEHRFFLQMAPNTSKDIEILELNATDEDANDTLWYSLYEFPYNDYVIINETTGVLSTNKSFEDLNLNQLEITVEVKDRVPSEDSFYKTDRAHVTIELIALI